MTNIFDDNDYQEIASRLSLVRVEPREFELQGEDCMYYMNESRIKQAIIVFTAALDVLQRREVRRKIKAVQA